MAGDYDLGAAMGPDGVVKHFDNFFEAGGTSLRAVQLIAMIKKELKQNLSIVSIFECPTARLLAAQVSAASEGRSSGADNAHADLRGQKRRANAIRRRVN